MKKSRISKYVVIIVIMAIMLVSLEENVKVFAKDANYNNIPYETYNYSYWGDSVPSPHAYVPERVIYGEDLGLGNFLSPSGMFVDSHDNIYMVDTGNNRIIISDSKFNEVKVIDNFESDKGLETFSEPTDVYVTEKDEIYIADSKNARIVVLNSDGTWQRTLEKPESELFDSSFIYNPQKIVVDRAERIYVIAKNVNQGIIELNTDGTFSGFVGGNKVVPDPIEYLWKMISTQAQKESMVLFVPTEYNNIFIKDDFLYSTTSVIDPLLVKRAANTTNSKSDTVAPIKKMNLTGTDILVRDGYTVPLGDLDFPDKGSITGPSTLVDVSVRQNGIYSVLDQKRGRVFTYSPNGELLYVFGGTGERVGNFKTPVAIEYLSDNRILVLDTTLNNITIFKNTYYETIISDAIESYGKGNYKLAGEKWEECLKYNSNFELAYVGKGRICFREGDYENAMEYFKLGNNREFYSKALKQYKKQFLYENIYLILTIALIVVIIVWILIYILRKRKFRLNIKRHKKGDGV